MSVKLDLDELDRNMRAVVQGTAVFVYAPSNDLVLALVARVRELELGMRAVLDSAHPNRRDHPAMAKQWERAEALLENGTVYP